MAYDHSDGSTSFESTLGSGLERFMAHVVVHAFVIGQRTSHDFLRHFPPSAIMAGLSDRADLRAKILEVTTGMKRKIALKKPAESAADDLRIALEESETSPDDVLTLFDPDDRVRFLAHQALWTYLTEDPFWKIAKRDGGDFERAKSMVAFMLDRALQDQLMSHQEVIEGIGVDKLAQLLPRPELEIALDAAISSGRRGQAFSDGDLIAELGSATVAAHIPLSHLWSQVIEPCIAVDHQLVAVHPVQGPVTHVGIAPVAEGVADSTIATAHTESLAPRNASSRAIPTSRETPSAPIEARNSQRLRAAAPPPPIVRPSVTSPPRLPKRRSANAGSATHTEVSEGEVVDIDVSTGSS